MPIDPSIALQVRPPQIDNPIQAASQMLGLKNLQQQGQMGQIQLQEAQQQQKDVAMARKAYTMANGDYDKAADFLAKNGGSPDYIMKLKKAAQDEKAAIAKLSIEDKQRIQAGLDIVLPQIENFMGTDPAKRTPEQWAQVRNGVVSSMPFLANQIPTDMPDQGWLDSSKAMVLGLKEKTKLDRETKVADSTISRNTAQQAAAESAKRRSGLLGDLDQNKLNIIADAKAHPEKLEQAIDALFPPELGTMSQNQFYKTRLKAVPTGDVEGVQKVLDAATKDAMVPVNASATTKARLKADNSPEAIKFAADKAAAVASATAPYKSDPEATRWRGTLSDIERRARVMFDKDGGDEGATLESTLNDLAMKETGMSMKELQQKANASSSEPANADSLLKDAASVSGGKPAPKLDKYDTKLTPDDETKFQAWKAKYAPRDSGADYDLRGAFKAGLKPDANTGHWPDTFKKPNHPTFSDQSKYAKDGKPGYWVDSKTGEKKSDGDKYVPYSDKNAASVPNKSQHVIVIDGQKLAFDSEEKRDAFLKKHNLSLQDNNE